MIDHAVLAEIFGAGVVVVDICALRQGFQVFVIPFRDAFMVGVALIASSAGVAVVTKRAFWKPRRNAALSIDAGRGGRAGRRVANDLILPDAASQKAGVAGGALVPVVAGNLPELGGDGLVHNLTLHT